MPEPGSPTTVGPAASDGGRGARPPLPPMPDRSRHHLRANAPVAFWMLAVVVVAVAHRWVPEQRWLLVHLLLLGAVMNAILVWSSHFTDALLRRRPTSRRGQAIRAVALNAGVLATVAGVVGAIWPLVLAGAIVIGAAVAAHGTALAWRARRARRALSSRFASTVHYYVVAAWLLPVGAGLGAVMALGLTAPWQARLQVAHVAVNLLGFVGLTVLGTLVTLWPTMLRTRIDPDGEAASRRALWLLAGSVAMVGAGAVGGLRVAVLGGLVGYLAGIVWIGTPMVRVVRAKPPTAMPTMSVLAGMCWLLVGLVQLVVLVARTPGWPELSDAVGAVTVPFAAGFAAQVLIGAMTYLVPVVLGGGPAVVRVTVTTIERGAGWRVALVNAGLVLGVAPVPSLVLVAASFAVLIGLGSFLPLLVAAVVTNRRARSAGSAAPAAALAGAPGNGPRVPEPRRYRGQAVAAVAVVALAVAVAVAADPAAVGAGTSAGAGANASGRITTVVVEAADMRFSPDVIEVPAGDELIIEVRNTDATQVHDLVLDNGMSSGRLAPGESATIDVGVVGRPLDAWCSVVGHRQMGMVLAIQVIGGAPPAAGSTAPDAGGTGTEPDGGAGHEGHEGHGGAAAHPDPNATPASGWEAPDAVVPPIGPGTTHSHTFTVGEAPAEVAPGVTQNLWTFNGTAPGPTLHGRIGDTFVITLVNDGTVGHSIDFHAGALAPDEPMRTIAPGESLTYTFTATRSGIWLYHCATMPMSAHIANGMFGAVIIDPPGLAPVDREYILVQSEYYLGEQGGEVDTAKVAAGQADLVVFNGYANAYDHAPLAAVTGERVRIWVLAAGPNRGTSFHVVGGQFDTVFAEGAYLLTPDEPTGGGAQTLALGAAQGGFVELVMPQAGHYPMVNHVMSDAERGAHGILEVRDP
ncbi:copper oxidase [Occultella glacieicola]|uniref:Copper-containing nitrite reductase n=1 Tax=Occultella glacieicola TaxID=2518684 RepID=A0ABY2DYD3_9MICO|nr:multicopper oxidase domain-containing protein [Occultella glacieicola]TDE88770.1 copper oxidase [Occultella glacieicola]